MARDFNGSNQRIDVNVNPDLGVTFSMWAWIRTDTIASGQGGIINSDESNDGNRNFQFRRNNDDVDFILFGSAGVETFTLANILNVTDNFFLGLARRGGNIFMYHGTGTTLTEVDQGASGTPDNDPADITIGTRRRTNDGSSVIDFFDGKIGNVGLLNTVGLTLGEMIGVMHKGLSFRSPLLTLPLYGAGSPEPDYSGNGNNGALINSPASADGFPVSPPFGFDLGWQGNFTSAVAGAGIRSMRQLVGVGQGTRD